MVLVISKGKVYCFYEMIYKLFYLAYISYSGVLQEKLIIADPEAIPKGSLTGLTDLMLNLALSMSLLAKLDLNDITLSMAMDVIFTFPE